MPLKASKGLTSFLVSQGFVRNPKDAERLMLVVSIAALLLATYIVMGPHRTTNPETRALHTTPIQTHAH